jgi:ribosomal protein S18 acetylase RimI-like enzyme
MSPPTFRRARSDDLTAMVELLADDRLGAAREDLKAPLNSGYMNAFLAIDGDPNQLLVVAEVNGEVVGCLQLTFIPGLSSKGALRGLIEGVRVMSERRGHGIGRAMMAFATGLCRERGCASVQLTTDKSREDAHRFYAKAGFAQSHLGFKRAL